MRIIKLSNELFLCALAWMIHHEVAHIRLEHSVAIRGLSMEEEKAADLEATKWVLEGLDLDDLRLKKRALGVATAVLTLQSLEVDPRHQKPRTHPPAPERVHYCLSRYELDPDQLVEAYTTVGLQVLFIEKGISPNVDGPSPAEILSQFLVDIARATRS